MEYTIKTAPSATWLVTSKRLRQPEIPRFAGQAIGVVEDKANALGLQIIGPPIFVYHCGDCDAGEAFLLEIAVAVNAATGDPRPCEFQQPPPLRCISATYIGSMRGIQDAWKEMHDHVENGGYTHAGVSREVYHYFKDFDSDENETELQVGIKSNG